MTKRQADLFPGLQSSKKYLSDYPLLVAEWHPTMNGSLSPDDYLHQSGKKVWWKCEYGHEWDARVHTRVKGSGCPYCNHRLASPDNNLTIHPCLYSSKLILKSKFFIASSSSSKHWKGST